MELTTLQKINNLIKASLLWGGGLDYLAEELLDFI